MAKPKTLNTTVDGESPMTASISFAPVTATPSPQRSGAMRIRGHILASTQHEIRVARREDVPAIAALIEEFTRYMHDLGDTSPPRLDAQALERDGFGANPAFQGLLAEVSGEIVGFLLHHAGYDTDEACRLLFVVDLYVAETARGHGIGAALMAEASKVAAGNGAPQVVWTVDKRNVKAKGFYERLGARYVEHLDLMYLDV